MKTRLLKLLLLTALGFGALRPAAHAATYSWVGGFGAPLNAWNTPANWILVGGTANINGWPGPADEAVFSGATAPNIWVDLANGPQTVSGLDFGPALFFNLGLVMAPTPALTLDPAAVVNNSGGAAWINPNVICGPSSGSATIQFNGGPGRIFFNGDILNEPNLMVNGSFYGIGAATGPLTLSGLTVGPTGWLEIGVSNNVTVNTPVTVAVGGTLRLCSPGGGTFTAPSVTAPLGATITVNATVASPTVSLAGWVGAGCSPGTANFTGDLILASTATLDFELDTPNVVGNPNDLIMVGGNLTLGGNLVITPGAKFADGVYRLANYNGTLTYSGLNVASAPGSKTYTIDTATLGQVNLIVAPDMTPPTLVSATASCVSDQVTVTFSELLNPASVGDTFAYAISGGVTVTSAVLAADGHTVVLSTSPLDEGVIYTLTVADVEDLAGNSIAPNPASINFACLAPPVITQQPHHLSVTQGESATFSVAVTGEGLTYQWQFGSNGLSPFVPIPGATNATLNIPSVQPLDYGGYQVIVSNPFGSTPSDVALLIPGVLKGLLYCRDGTPILNCTVTVMLTNAVDPPSFWQSITHVMDPLNGPVNDFVVLFSCQGGLNPQFQWGFLITASCCTNVWRFPAFPNGNLQTCFGDLGNLYCDSCGDCPGPVITDCPPRTMTVTDCIIPKFTVTALDTCYQPGELVITQTPAGNTRVQPGRYGVIITACNPQGTCTNCYVTVYAGNNAPQTTSLVLFNTGVNAAGGLLAPGAVDPHFVLTASADPTAPPPSAEVTSPVGSQWLQNSASPLSQWISPRPDTWSVSEPNGNYTYRTTFNLTGLDPNTAQITGRWAVDDSSTHWLNGVQVPGGVPINTYDRWTPFSITSGFIPGVNTLELRSQNLFGGPTGVRLEMTGTADTDCVTNRCVPPPAGIGMWLTLDERNGTATPSTVHNSVPGAPNGAHYNGVILNPGFTTRGDPVVDYFVNLVNDIYGKKNNIQVPDYSGIAVGAGHFSLDGWVMYGSAGTATPRIIMEKRGTVFGFPGIEVGFSFAVWNNRLLLRLADNSLPYVPPTDYVDTGATLSPNRLHFVAVTVRRDSPSGIQFYVDGVPTGTANPTMHRGDLNVPGIPLVAGHSGWLGFPLTGTGWIGWLDELELFRYVLTTSQVRGLWNAADAGKCKLRCRLPWDYPFPPGSPTVAVPMTICNDSGAPRTYNWYAQGSPTVPGLCNSTYPGPTQFSPPAGTVTVPARGCVTIPITVTRPAGITANNTTCFQVVVRDTVLGEGAHCESLLFVNDTVKVTSPAPGGQLITVTTNGTMATFQVENLAAAPQTTAMRLTVLDGHMQPNPPAVSVNGRPGGEPLPPFTITLAAGAATNLTFLVQFLEPDPGPAYSLVLEADLTGTGNYMGIMSLTLLNEECCATNTNPNQLPLLLSMSQSNNTVVLSWPADATSFGVEATDSLNPPIVWVPVNEAVQTVNGRNVITLPRSVLKRFFRLSSAPTTACNWSQCNTTSPLAARYEQTAVWTGSEWLIWGGYNGVTLFNDGSRYNPVTKIWTPMSTVNAPAARRIHTAVWTGSEMIVWGGADTVNYLNTGARYNPATDTWTPLPTTGAPGARQSHTAVWTGSEMVVWGGFSSGGSLNTGGRYNPGNNTWTAVPTTGAPVGRVYHTAVWDGSGMIVWGGNSGSALNSGGRYDPVANSWTAVTLTGAPTARGNHAAVWTGSEMIIWGTAINSGGRYNPAADSWTAVNPAGSPANPAYSTAVWTGSQMIVFGGFNGAVSVNNGGCYDPVANVWTLLPTAGAPSVRYEQTAVWDGNEMLLWGGRNAASTTSTVAADVWCYRKCP